VTKIIWAQDNTLVNNPTGGAEATNQTLLNHCSWEYEVVTPGTLLDVSQLTGKLLITNNIKFFSSQQIEWMLEQKRIRFEHDYWNLVEPSHATYKKAMWEGSVLNIFLSPAHFESYKKQHPDIEFHDVVFIPSCIDTKLLVPSESRNQDTVWIGSVTIHKGCLDALTWAKAHGTKLHIYGHTDGGDYCQQILKHPHACYEGTRTNHEMLQILSAARRFVHFPVWVEPYGRAVAEARLCGCEVVLGDKVGAASYPWWNEDTDTVRAMLDEVPNVFWKEVESAI
jgi:glycosyltransferase involved in cell wall biosynthesis